MSAIPVIRLAHPDDADNIASLVERYWEFECIKGFDAARIITLLNDLFRSPDRGQIWVAQFDGRLVAYLLTVYVFSLEHGGTMAEIDEFFVLAEHRSQGIGAALLRETEQTMAQAGLKRLQLQLSANNLGKGFYEKMGFEPRGYALMDKPLKIAREHLKD